MDTFQHAFTDLTAMGELVSKDHKVRVLMNGISDQWLEAAKNQVLATAHLKAMFKAAYNFMAEALGNKVSYAGSVVRKVRISITTTTNREFTGGQHAGQGCGTMHGDRKWCSSGCNNRPFWDHEVTYHYDTTAKWDRLNASQREKVSDIRMDKEKCSAAVVETKCGECNSGKQTKLDDTVETTPEHCGI